MEYIPIASRKPTFKSHAGFSNAISSSGDNQMSTSPDTSMRSLEEIVRRLNPNVPAGATADAMPRIPRDSNAVRQITTLLRADPFGKALLTGHIGVGKSTELMHLTNELAPQRFTIRCSIADSLGVHNADTFTLLVVVLEAAIRAWISQLLPMPPGLIEQLVERVDKLLPMEKRPPKPERGSRTTMSPALTAFQEGMRAMHEALGVGEGLERIRTGEQLAALYSDCIRRLAIRYVPDADLASIDVSAVVESCEVILKEIGEKFRKPVLLVIDDLDKVMDPALQQSLFIDRAMAWRRLPCAVVATLPFDAYFRERSAEIDQLWTEVLVLDPLPIPTPDGQDLSEPALQPYLTMLHEAGAERLFSARQTRRLAHASGGLPRTFIYFCSTCALYALEANATHVLNSHIDLVLQDMANKWRGRLTDSDYEGIEKVLQSEGTNVRNVVQPLRDGILIRDGSQQPDKQYRIAPWAEPLLNAYQKRTQVASTDAAKNWR
ncbi:MAG: hypothetical protein ABSG68_06775 [Thermoguttaceae bacterium]